MAGTLLQVEDTGGTRRNVGTVDDGGQGAIRVVAPDSESLLVTIRNRIAANTTELSGDLDAILTELTGLLEAADLQFTGGRLDVDVEFPADYPDAAAEATLDAIQTAVEGTLDVQVTNVVQVASASTLDVADAQVRLDMRDVRDLFVNGESPFSEQSVTERTPIFSLLSLDPLSILRDLWTEGGGGTVVHNVDEYRLSAPANGDTARLQSAARARYLPGFASECGVGIRVESRAGTGEVEWGAYDGTDGLRFRWDGDLYVERVRDGVVTESVVQQDWNVDRLDGNGRSGIDRIDDMANYLRFGHIWQVRYSWYGFGEVEFRLVGPGPDGRQGVWTLHRLNEDTDTTTVRQPSLPVWVEARDEADVRVTGRQATILGGEAFSTSRSVGDWRTSQSVGGTFVPLVAMRRRQGTRWADAVTITSDDYSLITSKGVIVQAFICPAGAVGDGTWTDVRNTPPEETAAEVNRSATTLDLTGAVALDPVMVASGAGGSSSTQSSTKRTPLVRDLELVLAARTIDGTNATVSSSLAWLEAR